MRGEVTCGVVRQTGEHIINQRLGIDGLVVQVRPSFGIALNSKWVRTGIVGTAYIPAGQTKNKR